MVFIVMAIGLAFWLSWRTVHVTGPARLIDNILTTQQVTINDLDLESIRIELIATIEMELVEQLSASNIEQPEQAAKLMLANATAFLEVYNAVVSQINEKLKSVPKAESEWQKLTAESDQQIYQAGNMCLSIVRHDEHWRLQSFMPCEPEETTL
jgi:ubiquitin-protein ligase